MDNPGADRMDAAASTASRPEPETASPPRRPGGKALLRLVADVESAGLTGLADAFVHAAVTANQLARFDEHTGPLRPSRATPARGRRRGAGNEVGPSTEDAAAEYGAAADALGQPVAGQPLWRAMGP